jgi:hypothetical protein
MSPRWTFLNRRFALVAVIALNAPGICFNVAARADDTKPFGGRGEGSVDFAHDIAPVLQRRCAKCHAGTQKKGGLSINTRQTLLAGGDTGPAAVPRKADESPLIERLSSADPELRMPPEGERLTARQIELFRRWIDGGVPWDEGFVFGTSSRQAPLAPRRPRPPSGAAVAGLSNPVDRFLYDYFVQRRETTGGTVSDRVFARRASLDLVGLAPAPAALDAFEADTGDDKRARFVERLLDDREAFATHWLTFWNDLLRNAYHGTGFIDGGRKQITGWLYAALFENIPYDRFVHELVSPDAGSGSEGFAYGIKWRGTVNESQRREIQAAQSVAQVFLGTNLKCASCHDSFVNHWKLTDAYALASVFAEAPLELHRCDQPTGTPATVGFLYPQLGAIESGASRARRQRQLAELLVHPENGRLARTIANRLWARLFGRGLVEPLDNMDAEPWHQDLLDFLAADLVDHGYDVKHTLRLLTTSRAYQLPGVVDSSASSESFAFRGPFVKRMAAEQFVDTVFALTSAWPEPGKELLKPDGRAQGGQLGAIGMALYRTQHPESEITRVPLKEAKWIWSSAEARQSAPPQTIYLRRVWSLGERPARAVTTFTADNSFELFVNGKSVTRSSTWESPVHIEATRLLVAGKNLVTVKAANGGKEPNPAGVIGEIVAYNANGELTETLSTDETWRISETEFAGWQKPEFDDSSWKPAIPLGVSSVEPWKVKAILEGRVAKEVEETARLPTGFRIRAGLLPLDSLQAALGRPNREQVVSARDSSPTMLQSLELTNGAILMRYLQRGAEHWQQQAANDPPRLIDQVYRTALTRPPTPAELQAAAEIVGGPATIEGIEDLLWTICMLPEFQLVP